MIGVMLICLLAAAAVMAIVLDIRREREARAAAAEKRKITRAAERVGKYLRNGKVCIDLIWSAMPMSALLRGCPYWDGTTHSQWVFAARGVIKGALRGGFPKPSMEKQLRKVLSTPVFDSLRLLAVKWGMEGDV